MNKLFCSIVLLLCLCNGLANASSTSEKKLLVDDVGLLRQDKAIQQMWAMAQNYRYGGFVAKDKVKALAWQDLYLAHLPKYYPQLKKLRQPFIRDLSSDEISQAKTLEKQLGKTYDLSFRWQEKDLIAAFSLKKKKIISKPAILATVTSANDFISSIREHDPELAERFENTKKNLLEKGKPLVYGQVMIDGPDDQRFIDGPVNLERDGLFLTEYQPKKTYVFRLLGYDVLKPSVRGSGQEYGLGRQMFRAVEKRYLSGLVGLVQPANAINKTFISLHLQGNYNAGAPWYTPLVHVTTQATGQFYVSDMVAGDYVLVVVNNKKRMVKPIHLNKGSVLNLGGFDLS